MFFYSIIVIICYDLVYIVCNILGSVGGECVASADPKGAEWVAGTRSPLLQGLWPLDPWPHQDGQALPGAINSIIRTFAITAKHSCIITVIRRLDLVGGSTQGWGWSLLPNHYWTTWGTCMNIHVYTAVCTSTFMFSDVWVICIACSIATSVLWLWWRGSIWSG